jgi:hypothetical protein
MKKYFFHYLHYDNVNNILALDCCIPPRKYMEKLVRIGESLINFSNKYLGMIPL